MNEVMILGFAALFGAALGAFFFGALWWTVKRGLSSKRPALWFAASFIIRTGVTLSGFYIVSLWHWQRFLACAAGFLAAQMSVKLLLKETLYEDKSR